MKQTAVEKALNLKYPKYSSAINILKFVQFAQQFA